MADTIVWRCPDCGGGFHPDSGVHVCTSSRTWTSDRVELDPPTSPAPAPDLVSREAAAAFAEEIAEARYQELIAGHDHKTCTRPSCGVCKELARVKAQTIPAVLEMTLDLVYDELVRAAATMDARTSSIDDLTRLMKARLSDLRTTPVADLWS